MVPGTSRPASAAINQPIASALANVAHKQRPASCLVTTSGAAASEIDIYRHPAVKAYMNAHPREAFNMVKFGPYLLLQTLDKGDSRKPPVRLGVHTQRGEEVAVEIIKCEDTSRVRDFEHEIEVLRVCFFFFLAYIQFSPHSCL